MSTALPILGSRWFGSSCRTVLLQRLVPGHATPAGRVADTSGSCDPLVKSAEWSDVVPRGEERLGSEASIGSVYSLNVQILLDAVAATNFAGTPLGRASSSRPLAGGQCPFRDSVRPGRSGRHNGAGPHRPCQGALSAVQDCCWYSIEDCVVKSQGFRGPYRELGG